MRHRTKTRPLGKAWPARKPARWRMPEGVKPLPGQRSLLPTLVPHIPRREGTKGEGDTDGNRN